MFNPKKKFFNKMLGDIERVIWNQEFKRFRILGLREQLRREYDQANDALNRVTAHLEADPKNEKVLEEQKLISQKVDQLKGQIDDLDVRLNGQLPNDVQDGLVGVTQELEASIETREYIKAFLKHNT